MSTADTAKGQERQKEVVCPCGTLLVRTPSASARGLKTCPGCERMIHFDIAGGVVRVRVEDREDLYLRHVYAEDMSAGAAPS